MKHKQLSSMYHNKGQMKDDLGQIGITLWLLRLTVQQSTVKYGTVKYKSLYIKLFLDLTHSLKTFTFKIIFDISIRLKYVGYADKGRTPESPLKIHWISENVSYTAQITVVATHCF